MKVIPIPCSFDNYSYLIVCRATNIAAVVDPGEAYPVMQCIEREGVELKMVLCTHHHHDHIGEMPELMDEYK